MELEGTEHYGHDDLYERMNLVSRGDATVNDCELLTHLELRELEATVTVGFAGQILEWCHK